MPVPSRPLLVLALAGLLGGCGGAEPPTSAPAPPTASPATPSAAPSDAPAPPVDPAAVRAETTRALAAPPPPPEIRGGGLGFAVGPDGGLDVGTLGTSGVTAAAEAALAAVQVLTRTPGLLRFDTPRTAEDLAPVTALVHPDLRPRYDAALAAFLGSSYNDPGLPAPDAAADEAVAFLQGLTSLFTLVPGDDPLPAGETVRDELVFGFGGAGAGAYGELVVTGQTGFDPTGDAVSISLPYTVLYNTVGPDGSLLTSAVVNRGYQLRMQLSGGQWLVAGVGFEGREGRTVERRG